jgi:Tfp pilus assembly protein PilX
MFKAADHPHLLRRLWRRLGSQRGFILPATIGMCTVLTMAGTTAVAYSTSNLGTSHRQKAGMTALALAEAGLNDAYATLHNASNPTMSGAVPQQTVAMDGGTVTYYGTLSGNTWTLTGVGRSKSPITHADVVRTVRGNASITSMQQGGANNVVWNYVYADSLTTCTTLPNSVNVNVPFYIRGNLCLNNSSQVSGGTLQVGGTVTINNSATIGSAASPITEAHIGGGCRLGSGTLHNPCSAGDRVYASVLDNAPQGLTKPPIDLADWYQNAAPGPMHPCTTGSFPGGFDTDTTMNRSLTSAVNLTPSVPYDCRVTDAAGNIVGRLAWTPGSPGTLIIAGTVFFDGDIVFQNSVNAIYQGRATIYAAGTITIQNSSLLCGVAGCNTSWNATQNLLAFVAGSSTDSTGFSIANSSTFQGAIYAVNDYTEQNGSTVWGPIVARQLFFANSTTNHYVPLGTLLSGMPQSGTTVVGVANDQSSWG